MINIEIKVRLGNRAMMLRRIRALGAHRAAVLRQTDTYFRTAHGRLKLREETGCAYLIAYMRPDRAASRASKFLTHTVPAGEVANLRAMLTATLGTAAVVRKVRTLYLYEHTRIHVDRVAGLGDFLELETVVDGQSHAAARREHAAVVAALALDTCEPLAVSYSDLLMN